MDIDEKLELVKRNTAEIITEKEIKELLEKKKQPVVYLGTAVTGRPHVGYFTWVIKFTDLIRAGFKVKVLLADLHGLLDGTAWEVLEKRYEYYKEIIPLMFAAVGADLNKIELVKGSDIQLNKNYFLDVLKMSTFASVHDSIKASSEVVKQSASPKLCGLIYPIMQSVDEEYLKVDVQAGGTDQRKILVFARENLPKIGYKPRVELLLPLIPGLIGKKMSASDPRSKIDLLDDEDTVKSKIKSAYCEVGVIEDNGILAFLKYVLMVLKGDKKESFTVERPEKFGGNLEYKNYESLEKDYASKKLHPLDLKNAVEKEINNLLQPFRKARAKLLKLSEAAY